MKLVSVLLLILNMLLVACSAKNPQEKISQSATATSDRQASQQIDALCERQEHKKPLVVTTIAPLTNIVSNIAGDRVEVKGIISEGTDSHTFKPRPSHTGLLATADLIIVNGMHLETPTEDLANSVKCQSTKIYKLGDKTISKEQWIFDFSFPKEKGDPNPHLWMNTKYAEAYAKFSAQWLTELDPAGKDYYASNLKHYLQRLELLDMVTREVVASIPPQNRKLLTYHDSWAYWAKEYGFEVIGAIQPSSFKEPSTEEVAKLVAQIRRIGVPAIFGSEVYPSQVEEKIASKAHVKTANTNDDELPGTDGSADAMENKNPRHTYIGMMAHNLEIIASKLGGNPTLVKKLNTANVVGPSAEAIEKP